MLHRYNAVRDDNAAVATANTGWSEWVSEAGPRLGGRRHSDERSSPQRSLGQRKAARTITIDGEHAGRRLDKFLRSQFKGVPAGLLFRLLRQGKLRVNGRKAQQNHRLQEGDVIDVPELHVDTAAAPRPAVPSTLLDQLRGAVLHEDDDLLIIDKPAGAAVHRGTDVSAGVVEALQHLRPELPELELSHRLDRGTSGVLALAKTPSMLRYLHGLLRDRKHEIERHYLAVVAGRWPADMDIVDAPLRREEDGVVVAADGQSAETRVSVKRRIGNRATVVDVRLVTGRKHQIRVHLSHAGHPIAGDDRYGDRGFNRRVNGLGGPGIYLHAAKLVIPKPDGADLVVTAPMPRRWKALLNSDL
nr:RluA family pseudouridine synthase [Brevibacterium renqingii]